MKSATFYRVWFWFSLIAIDVGLAFGAINLAAGDNARVREACTALARAQSHEVRWLPIDLDDYTVDLLGDGSIRVPLEDYLALERSDWWVNRAARVMVDQHNSGEPMPLERRTRNESH